LSVGRRLGFLACAAALLLPARAMGATLYRVGDGDGFRYEGAAGEANRVDVQGFFRPSTSRRPPHYHVVIRDPGARRLAARGCGRLAHGWLRCNGVLDIDFNLGDGDDRLLVRRSSFCFGHDAIGGDGNDVMVSLLSSNCYLWWDGHAGNDTIRTGATPDRLRGGSGDDVLVSGARADELQGGPGSDRLSGGSGDDLIGAGGDGDFETGQDTVSAGSGDDSVGSADGYPDRISCGPGRDRADVDAGLDVVDRDCEIVHRLTGISRGRSSAGR
jgi:Ca2+-binding RTX toxin-like protein